MSQIFISYRREDSAGYAGRLRESLERRLGKGAVFRDVDALQPGQDFVDTIAIRLRDASACLVLIGREWLDAEDSSGRRRLEQENDYVRLEIATALGQPHMRVVPVLVEGTRMPATEELPETLQALARRQAVSLRDESWDEDVKRFVTALDRRSWVQRYRLALAASAAAVLVALVLTQYFSSQISPDTGTATSVAPPEPLAAPAAPATSPSTVTGPADPPLRREGPQDPDPLPGASRNVVARGGPSSPTSSTTPLAGRTAQPAGAGSGRTGRVSVPPSVSPDVASTARPTVVDSVTVTQPRPANDGDVVTRPPATSAAAPPAAAPPVVVIPPRPTITPAALVRQTIAEYERAAEALEFEGVKRIWPAAPDALRNSYRNLRSQSVDLDCAEAAIASDTATISCKEQIRSVGAGGITLPVATNTATFSLRRNGDAWEISRISRQPR
jgi:hypothetical protein